MNTKILIINPPAANNVRIVREGRCMQRQEAWGTSWAPLSLALIAAVLRDKGFDILLKDCSNDGINFDGLKKIIFELKPSIVIVNTATPSINSDLKVACLAKSIDPDIKTIFFGIHVSALPLETFEMDENIQFIAKGEPEYILRDFAIAVKDRLSFSSVRGLIFKNDKEIIENPAMPPIDLDELPFPAWEYVKVKNYRLPITGRSFLLATTSRGCPYNCAFCAAGTFYGKEKRLRSPERIVSEIEYVRNKFGVNDVLFWSENGISDKGQMLGITAGLIAKVPGIRWVCNGRVDMVDEIVLRAMKSSGCWMIGYGIESASARVLKLMKKGITCDDIKNAVTLTKKNGIEVTAHIVIGFPGERKEDILQTERFVSALDVDYIQVYCAVPFPGSALYDEAKKEGWISTDKWYMFEQNFSVLDTPLLKAKEVMELREHMIKRFYFNRVRLAKCILKIRKLHELLFFIKFALKYFLIWVIRKRI